MQAGTQAVQPCLSPVEVVNTYSCPLVRTRENMQKTVKNKTKTNRQKPHGVAHYLRCTNVCVWGGGQCQNLVIPLYLSKNESPPIVGKQSPKVLAGQVDLCLAPLTN